MPQDKQRSWWYENFPKSQDVKMEWEKRLILWKRSSRNESFDPANDPGQIDWELGGRDKDDRD